MAAEAALAPNMEAMQQLCISHEKKKLSGLKQLSAYVVNTRLLNSFAHANNTCIRLLNIDYLIAEKWSSHNWTSQTGSTAPVLVHTYLHTYSLLILSLTHQTHNYVTEEILRMEPEEGIEKIQEALRICKYYRDTYMDRCGNLAQYFKERPVVEWDFQSSLVFARLDRFTSQLTIIEVF